MPDMRKEQMRRRVMLEKATEPPFSGEHLRESRRGTYACAGCGQVLFGSDSKFDSGCGWPSFDTARPGAVEQKMDLSHSMARTEIICSGCKGHLGHVFSDGPTATGKRYCVNSVALDFTPGETDE